MDLENLLLNFLCDDDEAIQAQVQATSSRLLSSSGTSQSIDVFALGALLLSERKEHEKLQGYSNIVLQMEDREFFNQFRISPQTFDVILEELFPVPEIHQVAIRRGKIPVENKVGLLITLWYLGHQTTYNEISQQFGISLSCCHRTIEKFTLAISDLSSKYIKWPSLEQIPLVEAGFRTLSSFPDVIGAIDGCHIKFKAPANQQKDYLDRTCNHSTTLLAICDSNMRFTYTLAGFPGSAHDQRVLSFSGIGKKLEEDPLSLCFSKKYHIIGDSAFALKNYMMVPFRDNGSLNAAELLYNTKLSQTRRVIENSFAWLKGRFRKLKYIDADVHRVQPIITAACVLHNISLQLDGDTDNIELDETNSNDAVNINNQAPNVILSAEAKRKREKIVQDLMQTL